MNEIILSQKLQALARFPILDAALIKEIGAILRGLDDWSLFRINPLRFASQYQMDPAAVTDFFVHGAKVGLLDFSYNMVCPGCGGIEYSHATLDQIEPDMFHCTTCNYDVASNLDDQVKVTFSLNPAVGEVTIDPYTGPQDYYRYFFNAETEVSPTMLQRQQQDYRGFVVMEPDEDGKITFQAEPPRAFYRLWCLEVHSVLYIRVSDQKSALPQIVDIELVPRGFSPTEVELAAGEVTLHVHNRTKGKCGMNLSFTDFEQIVRILQEAPNTWHPYLTGKMLLNNQSFRDLFRIQSLTPDLHLNVRSLTVLFTDLKNSTKMYGQAGDAVAYSLVKKHFDLLIQVVRHHSGSIVKTMGDAIMATFSSPQDGVQAALEMIQEVEPMLALFQKDGYETGLKIGLNEGPALAVNADDRLDYFGQNINVAARVQGLADAGEIWLTEAVFGSYGVEAILRQHGYQLHKQSALLRGVNRPAIVYQCTLPKT